MKEPISTKETQAMPEITEDLSDIHFDADGWWANGRCFSSLVDAKAALDHPVLDIPRVLANLGQGCGSGEGMSAYEILDQLADGLIAMMVPTADANEAQNLVNGSLAVCAIRLRDTARTIGPPPVDTNGGF